MISLAIFDRDNPNTAPIASLTESSDRTWHDPLGDAGGGSFTLPLGSGGISACVEGNIVRGYIDGQVRSAWRIMKTRKVLASDEEDAGRVLEVSGPGVNAILEDAAVYSRFATKISADDRRFDFTDLDYPDADWVIPAIVEPHPFPDGWLDYGASWFWAPGYSSPFPRGEIYWRRRLFLLPNADTPSDRYAIVVSADDGFEVWIDGSQVLAETTPYMWAVPRTVDVTLEFGIEHMVAIKGINVQAGGTDVAGVIFSLIPYQDGGANLRPQAPGDPAAGLRGIMRSNQNEWLCVGYPAQPPGMTPGRILVTLLVEAQARGALSELTWDFDESVDSAGAPWPTTIDFVCPVGATYLEVAAKLHEETGCELVVDPANLVVHLYASYGVDRSAEVRLAWGDNVSELTVARDASAKVGAVLARSADGWSEHVGAPTSWRREHYVSAGSATAAEAERVVDQVLVTGAEATVAVESVVEPVEAAVAYVDYRVGDWVTVVDGDDDLVMRVVGLTVSEDEAGEEVYVLELGTIEIDPEIRLARAVRSTASGTMGGRLASATPRSPLSNANPGVTKVSPPAPPVESILAYDSFNRPDGLLTVSDSGHVWRNTGTPRVRSNRCESNGAADVRLDLGLKQGRLSARVPDRFEGALVGLGGSVSQLQVRYSVNLELEIIRPDNTLERLAWIPFTSVTSSISLEVVDRFVRVYRNGTIELTYLLDQADLDLLGGSWGFTLIELGDWVDDFEVRSL